MARRTRRSPNVGTGFNNQVLSVAVQADGKIVVGGLFSAPNGSGQSIARLNSDGTRDTTFTTNIAAGFNDFVSAVAVQADSKWWPRGASPL